MPTHIGRYRLTDPDNPHSVTSTAFIWEAMHPELGMPVAIKVLRPELGNEEYVQAFRLEAEQTARLEHENILEIHDSGLSEDSPYAVFAFVPDSLYRLLSREGQIPWQRAVGFGIQTCRALQYVHDQGIIHLDVKPSNLLLTIDGTVKLSDFGISALGHDIYRGPVGTPGFMAPEQWRGGPVDGRADLYSLGITLYELIAGYAPFKGGNVFELGKMHESQPLPSLPNVIEVPQSLRAVISKATLKDREDRYSTADEMKKDLETVLVGDGEGSPDRHQKEMEYVNERILQVSEALWDLVRFRAGEHGTDDKALVEAIEKYQLSLKEDGLDSRRERGLTASPKTTEDRLGQGDLRQDDEDGVDVEAEDAQKRIVRFTEAITLEPDDGYNYRWRAHAYHELEEYQKAVDDFSEAITLEPDDGYNYRSRGRSYHELEEYQKAVDDFSEAIGLQPDDGYNYLWRGMAYHELEEYQKAVDDFSEAITLQPDDGNNYFWRGRAYDALKEYQKAVDDFSEAIGLEPDDGDNYWWRGRAYYDLEEYQKTVDDFTEAIRLHPDDGDNYFGRGRSYHELEEYQKAVDDLTEAITLQPDDGGNYRWRGIAYHALKEYQKAVDDYTEAITLQPDHGYNYHGRGRAYHALGKYQKAAEDFTEAITLQPDDGYNYRWRSRAYYDLEEYQKAVDDLTEAITLQPDDGDNYLGRGRAYHELEEYQKAVDDLTEAIGLQPDDGYKYRGRGRAYHALEEYQNAADDFTEAIRLQPDDGDNYRGRGRGYHALEEYQNAADDFTEAISLQPDDGDNYRGRGRAYHALEEYQNAADDFTEAIMLQPDYSENYRSRAEVYGTLHQYETAIQDCNQALLLEPYNQDVYGLRGDYYQRTRMYSKALEDYSKAIEILSDYDREDDKSGLAEIYQRRGVVSAEIGNLTSARDDWEFAIQLRDIKTNAIKGPDRIGRYQILETIGGNGLSKMHRAIDVSLKRTVAIRVLSDWAQHDPETVDIFSAEFWRQTQLDHPNIVRILGFNTGPIVHSVMEYLPISLQTLINDADHALELVEAVNVVIRVCNALSYIHGRGIVHGAVKPSNILLSEQGVPKLGDFRLARDIDRLIGDQHLGPRTEPMRLGSRAFMAPELSRGMPSDRRTDIYALGVTLFLCLTGELPPMTGRTAESSFSHLTSYGTMASFVPGFHPPVPRMPEHLGIPSTLEEVVRKALAELPDDRFQTARDMSLALEPFQGQ